jgi:hypothetical protein
MSYLSTNRQHVNVIGVFLECELRRMYSDHHQPLIFVSLGPSADIGKCAYPVDASIGPEFDEDDFFAQVDHRQFGRIEPLGLAINCKRYLKSFNSAPLLCAFSQHRRPRERASPGVHRATQRHGLRYAM